MVTGLLGMEKRDRVALMAATMYAGGTGEGSFASWAEDARKLDEAVGDELTESRPNEAKDQLMAVLDAARDVVNAFDEVSPAQIDLEETTDGAIEKLRAALVAIGAKVRA